MITMTFGNLDYQGDQCTPELLPETTFNEQSPIQSHDFTKMLYLVKLINEE